MRENRVAIDFQIDKEERILENVPMLKDGLNKIGYLQKKNRTKENYLGENMRIRLVSQKTYKKKPMKKRK